MIGMGIAYDNKTMLCGGFVVDSGITEVELKPMEIQPIKGKILKDYQKETYYRQQEDFEKWFRSLEALRCDVSLEAVLEAVKEKKKGDKNDMLVFGNERKLIYRSDEILDFDILKKNKVVRVLFTDSLYEKMVCHEEDTFDLRQCLYIAIAKHLYKDTYTFEGIEWKAKEISYQKRYVKMVDKVIAHYKTDMANAEKMRKVEEEKKRAIANKKRKHAEYLKRREQKRLDAQAKAICEGLKLYDNADKNQ